MLLFTIELLFPHDTLILFCVLELLPLQHHQAPRRQGPKVLHTFPTSGIRVGLKVKTLR